MKHLHFKSIITLVILMIGSSALSYVLRHNNQVYIIDQTGYQWDVTQALSLGFNPEKFQYGIGKNAFTPLDDSDLKSEPDRLSHRARVIGVRDGEETHAYSVARLRYHEIANTRIGDTPIAAGY